ncbi:transposase [Streptomyces sp. NPDC056387]|uniref:transposase n=1 Tax=Streptomyces sp. NPDC056387 TaxID=3345803 RepID=UPI0035E2178A
MPDELWSLIEPLWPGPGPAPKRAEGRPRVPDRQALCGILLVLHTGIQRHYLSRLPGFLHRPLPPPAPPSEASRPPDVGSGSPEGGRPGPAPVDDPPVQPTDRMNSTTRLPCKLRAI